MNNVRKCKNYWTKDKCKEEALKYDNRTEFQKKSTRAYYICRKNDWIDDFCSHMNYMGNRFKRCIYAYEFSDNHVYIGLTYNIENRNKTHLKDKYSTVFNNIQKNDIYVLKQLTDYINVEDAMIKEGEYVEKYKNNDWVILNKRDTGGLGGNNLMWTKDKCTEISSRYKNKRDLKKEFAGCYIRIIKEKWLELFNHMELQKPNGYWTKENCQLESLKYKNREDFRKNSSSAYGSSLRNKWLYEITKHMKIRNKWTYENCKKESLKYEYIGDFRKNSKQAYTACLLNNWKEDLCSNMIYKKKKSNL